MYKKVLVLFLIVLLVMPDYFGNAHADYDFEYLMSISSEQEGNSFVLQTPTSIDRDEQGNYYVADLANDRIVILNSQMQKIGQISELDMPITVYIDNQQNIIICELGSHKVIKYNQELQRVTEWGGAGTEEGKFNIPRSVVQDSQGNYFVSDELNHRIQKFDINGSHISTYGNYGTQNGQFRVQQGLSIDSNDRLYVADTYNNRIQIFETYPEWNFVSAFGQYGVYQPFNYFSFQPNIFNHPRNVYVNKETGRILVTDSLNGRVMLYSSYEEGISFRQSQNGFLTMNLPTDAILDRFDKIVALDSYNRIIKYSTSLSNSNLYAEYGLGSSNVNRFCGTQSVAIDPITKDVYVTDSFNHRIKKYNDNCTFITSYGGIGGTWGIGTLLNYFAFPKQITVDDNQKLYVADFGNKRIVSKANNSNQFRLEVGSLNLEMPWGVAVDSSGKIFVSDWGDHKIKVFENGRMINSWGGSGSQIGQLSRPSELRIGYYNDNEVLAVADTLNNRVQIFDLSGEVISVIGSPTNDPLLNYKDEYLEGNLLLPYSMDFDSENNLIVMDTSHKCIRVYDFNGELIKTYGEMSNSDGNFFSPIGCDYGADGTLWVTDSVLQRVSKFNIIP